jgi:hypothetical protein
MTRLITYSAILLIFIGFRAEAATEYLRFTGSISPAYDSGHDGYDPTYGLTANQTVYFDFAIDTALDAAGRPDGSFEDNFFATYAEGSVTGNGNEYGQTVTFPEGITSWLFVVSSLRVGINWDTLDDPQQAIEDYSVNIWFTGAGIDLLGNSYFGNNKIANLTLVYRASTPPPAYVPLPAAIWLFGTGLACLLGSMTRRRTHQEAGVV